MGGFELGDVVRLEQGKTRKSLPPWLWSSTAKVVGFDDEKGGVQLQYPTEAAYVYTVKAEALPPRAGRRARRRPRERLLGQASRPAVQPELHRRQPWHSVTDGHSVGWPVVEVREGRGR